MNKNKFYLVYTLPFISTVCLLLLVIASCSHKEPQTQRVVDKNKKTRLIDDPLSNANKVIAQNEETLINQYILRRKWPVKKMDNGIRIWEYEKGKGNRIDYEDVVTIKYTLEAINGVLIYDQEKTFVNGKGEVETGLDDALRQLQKGSKAKIIIPSHLGYGFVGDGDRIPKLTILIYDLWVKDIK